MEGVVVVSRKRKRKQCGKKAFVSYTLLWIRFAEREMNRTELRQKVGFTSATLAKLGQNEPVGLKTLFKICQVLDCTIQEIMEFKKLEPESKVNNVKSQVKGDAICLN